LLWINLTNIVELSRTVGI